MENIIDNYANTLLPIGTIMLLLLLLLLYVLFRYKKELNETQERLEEKEEKIKWFRQIDAENERKRVALAHKVELETQSLQNNIERLEKEAEEGTKNQVIAKLEVLQSKREKLLHHAGLSHTEA